MTIKIYKIDSSPPARAVLMTAKLLKLNYEAVDVDFAKKEHFTPEYLEKNPQRKVPLLDYGEFALTDSHAIITYLVFKYGAEKRAKLYPNELSLRATIDSRLNFDILVLFPPLYETVLGIFHSGPTEPTPKKIAQLTEGYDVLEKYLEKTKFVAADHMTIADVSIVASICSTNVLLPLDEKKYPKVHAWWHLLKEENFYKKGNVQGLNRFIQNVKTYSKFQPNEKS